MSNIGKLNLVRRYGQTIKIDGDIIVSVYPYYRIEIDENGRKYKVPQKGFVRVSVQAPVEKKIERPGYVKRGEQKKS